MDDEGHTMHWQSPAKDRTITSGSNLTSGRQAPTIALINLVVVVGSLAENPNFERSCNLSLMAKYLVFYFAFILNLGAE